MIANNVIEFPGEQVRRRIPRMSRNEKLLRNSQPYFIDAEEDAMFIVSEILNLLPDYGYDLYHNTECSRDVAMLVTSMKALLCRCAGLGHDGQEISDDNFEIPVDKRRMVIDHILNYMEKDLSKEV